MKTTRTLKLTILNEDEEVRKSQYKFIRDSQYAQYKALNIATSYLGALYLEYNDFNNDEYKERKASFKFNLSNPKFEGITFGEGIDTPSAIRSVVNSSLKKTPLKEIARGERTLPNYKRTYPLLTRGRDLFFSYGENNEIYIDWIGKRQFGANIRFKVLLGYKGYNDVELMHTLNKIIEGQNLLAKEKDKATKEVLKSSVYTVSESKLLFDKKGNLLIKLSVNIPKKEESKYISGRTLGVDLGIKYPAYVCLSDDTYKRSHIGEASELIKQREQYQARRRRTQQQLKNVKGGKGRGKKLKNLERLSDCERNFVKTYNHMISKRIVEFAKKYQCEFINLEKLTKGGFDNAILRNWSYYELQSMIVYKAEREGIKVRYINPAYTSQMCSSCHHIDKENRQTQEKFVCTKCGFELNADHNAAINIARGGVSSDDIDWLSDELDKVLDTKLEPIVSTLDEQTQILKRIQEI